MARCTVVIPSYERPDHVAGALDSLAAQAEPGFSFNVVVVDDGSDIPIELPETVWPMDVRLIRLPENKGRSAARNAGIEAVDTELTVFMDDDMRAVPGYIRAWLETVPSDGTRVGIGRVEFHPDIPKEPLTRYLETRGVLKLAPGETIPYRYFGVGNSAIPTHLLRSVGGFDESLLAWGGEDIELGLRLARFGATFVHVPKAGNLHAHRRDLAGVWSVSERFGRESMPLLFQRHPSLERELRADILGPTSYSRSNSLTRRWKRILVRTATSRPLPDIVRWLVTLWPNGPWPMRTFDYLIASAWRRGLDSSVRGDSG
jgi:GT2 family glycosyltransferase